MAYFVNITSRAERDLADLYLEVNAESSSAALKWYLGLKESVLSLEAQPNRCPVTRKRGKLRHLLYGHKPRRDLPRHRETEAGRSAAHPPRRKEQIQGS
jgi:hypothetical protein